MDEGCPRSSARDVRRLGILEVARGVFMEDGFATASMSTIAARVGGSKGTLYNYFPSKHELFAAVIQHECDLKQAAMFDSLEARGEDVEAVLREVGRRYTQLVLGEPSMLLTRMVVAESTRSPELGRVLYEAGPKRARLRMTIYVEDQIAAGRLRAADATRMVEQYCDMCLAGLYRQRLMNVSGPPSEQTVCDNVEAALTVILTAYGPKSQPHTAAVA